MASANNVPEEKFQALNIKESELPCVLVLGMAGSGKTTFVQRLTSHLHSQKKPPYVINLDPAVHELSYPANIDIRDTVNYKEVMKQYQLGPNGGIMTALNLFATKFDEVLNLLEKKADSYSSIILDTPGQIEVFTWSASGTVITELLASSFPTMIMYIMDTARSTNPVTFMSNMLYACSILYKTKLPFTIILNKIDIVDASFIKTWMNDFEEYHDALDSHSSYMSNLSRSLSLALDEFYTNIKCVDVSSVTGQGMDEVLIAIKEAVTEFNTEYKPEIQRKVKLNAERKVEKKMTDEKKKEAQSDLIFSSTNLDVPVDKEEFSFGAGNKEEDDELNSEMLDECELKEKDSFQRFLDKHV